ncbi:gliding motility-associated C-terminal domain-containing protein [Chitinophaga nivalis]|uniref:Gliding motility-associated C-terminal domain-containing protein n=1 Tax=Chitinophaga nivalis TaxID=2991709 RepID=A0ABT3IPC0_9BACT|nr:gliding motility-associated C-terminal domain-containing protein [Chitinophaga nivalis]MCW3464674.1 gliding motility-associated C-terminal domain-containing protein [Chitinophaga nivalis]MCW3485635.1 gliding motility-associated C-terminal domain-containing protein [Chitinophaga nivalis]
MKKIQWMLIGIGCWRHCLLCERISFYLRGVFVLVMVSSNVLFAQDIPVQNPSLEGVPGQGKVPPPWRAKNTPDIQPGVLQITQPPSDGTTYIGLHSGPTWPEAIAQEAALVKGKMYTISFDLAYAPSYAFKACYGNLALYGGNRATDTIQRFWTSGIFYHTEWKRYTAVFKAAADYDYISFWADAAAPCDQSIYGSALLMDNLSATIREMPQVTLTATSTCKGESKGAVTATVKGVAVACTYLWSPGGQTTPSISGLAAGTYTLTVTHPNGTTATATATVKPMEVKSEVTTIPSPCYGDNENQILLTTTGGTPPYRYYFDGSTHSTYTPAFKKLHPGYYDVLVKDEAECKEQLNDIKVTEPALLRIASAKTHDISCSDTRDGSIALQVSGGTRPYAYQLEGTNWQSDSVWAQLEQGKYYYRVKDKNNCEVSGSSEIIRNERVCAVYIPNAFSPNGDGLNDVFRAKINDDIRDYKMMVYSRWGRPVFQSQDPAAGWDGRDLPTGTYMWVVTYIDSKQQARRQQGTILLIR